MKPFILFYFYNTKRQQTLKLKICCVQCQGTRLPKFRAKADRSINTRGEGGGPKCKCALTEQNRKEKKKKTESSGYPHCAAVHKNALMRSYGTSHIIIKSEGLPPCSSRHSASRVHRQEKRRFVTMVEVNAGEDGEVEVDVVVQALVHIVREQPGLDCTQRDEAVRQPRKEEFLLVEYYPIRVSEYRSL